MTVTAERLRTDDLRDPIGIGNSRPVLSWNVRSTREPDRQSALEVQVAHDAGFTDIVWASGRLDGEQPWVRFGGDPLPSRSGVFWRVRVWDSVGAAAAWSVPAVLETGLLTEQDWSASWITHQDWVEGADPVALPLLAKDFTIDGPISLARLYACGAGVYLATVNGEQVTHAALEPPYSDFGQTIDYATYDVTELLHDGANVLGVALGTGISHVTKESDRYTKFTGTIARPRALLQLEIVAADGTVRRIGTDTTWRAALGPTTRTHWYGGEDHDTGRHIDRWDRPDGDRSTWPSAVALVWKPRLTARAAPQIRIVEEIAAVEVSRPVEGVQVFDLGVNIAGWPLLRLDAPAGQAIQLLPGELLEPDGLVSQRHTGSPILDVYRTRDGTQSWHPEFVYHGFRYLQAHGLPDDATVSGLVLRADNEPTGHFSCSDELLNGIHRIIDRAVQGNMFSVLTDCPHREKLGWLEQVHLLFSVVSRGYDVRAYYRDLLRRTAEAQTQDGLVPDIAPEYVEFAGGFRDDPNWGSAIILAPWEMYRAYGDLETLQRYYPNMVRYLRFLGLQSDDGILDYGLGDWITLDESTPRAVAATWGYHRAAAALANIADVLGNSTDAREFRELTGTIGRAFQERFFDGVDSYGSGSQACDAFALDLDIAPPALRPAIVRHLVDAITSNSDHLTVGEIALPAIFRVLSAAGQDELIHRIATRTDWPSYGFQLEHGATALTEAWDGPTRGLSQNHFMLGAIDDWFTSRLAGLGQRSDSVGYRNAVIAPMPVGDLTAASAAFLTPYGRLASSWRIDGNTLTVAVDIPVGIDAQVRLPEPWRCPAGTTQQCGSGHWTITATPA